MENLVFKISELAVSHIVLDIKVCKACVSCFLQESDGLVHNFSVHLIDDGNRISDSLITVVFQDAEGVDMDPVTFTISLKAE